MAVEVLPDGYANHLVFGEPLRVLPLPAAHYSLKVAATSPATDPSDSKDLALAPYQFACRSRGTVVIASPRRCGLLNEAEYQAD